MGGRGSLRRDGAWRGGAWLEVWNKGAGALGGSLRAWGPVCFEAIWAPSWIATYLRKTHFQQLGMKIVIKKSFPEKVICWAFQKFLERFENK